MARVDTAHSLYDEGVEAFRSGDAERSRELNERSLRLATDGGDPAAAGMALIGLCRLAFRAADYEEGRALAGRARAAAGGDLEVEVRATHMEAEMLRAERRYAEAMPLYEENIERWRGLGDDHGVTMEIYNLGAVLALAGDAERAAGMLRDAIDRSEAEEDVGLLRDCVAAAGGAVARSEPRRALRLITAARAAVAAAGEVFDPAEEAEVAEFASIATDALDSADAELARAEGGALSLEEAVAEAREAL
jgi:tetratricopeptide (TPR) repeat protein